MKIDPRDIIYTHHARQVMERRDVSGLDVEAVLSDPETSTNTSRGLLYSRGDLTVVTDRADTGRTVVITVLLRSQEQWTDEDARARRRP